MDLEDVVVGLIAITVLLLVVLAAGWGLCLLLARACSIQDMLLHGLALGFIATLLGILLEDDTTSCTCKCGEERQGWR